MKQNKASEQKALNIIPAPMSLTPPPPCSPPPYPIRHLPDNNNTSGSSEMNERKQNYVRNISAFQSTWFDIQN